jgi:hypothetical protein
MMSTADTDDDQHIDTEEFLSLVKEYSTDLEKIQRSKLLSFMRVAAYADEYRLVIKLQQLNLCYIYIFIHYY